MGSTRGHFYLFQPQCCRLQPVIAQRSRQPQMDKTLQREHSLLSDIKTKNNLIKLVLSLVEYFGRFVLYLSANCCSMC